MVFYRKYRPQTIQELDSAALREQLSAVLAKSEVAHAFLFTGPKGLGKTSTARIVAKAVNCLAKQSDSIEPCNECEQCTSITNGSNLDVMELDAASNRGIDEIRDLREKIKLAPVAARKKIYIIDEVHMLTTEAFNALLKTLEEPPPHVMFILCTTEIHKVPATIMSRCNHISFRRATIEELKRSFQRIAKGEGLKIDDDALHVLAKMADGGFRDGVKVLEEVALAAGGKKITADLITQKYNVSNLSVILADLLDSFARKNIADGLSSIQKLIDQGIDMKYAIEQMINHLHHLLLVSVNAAEGSEVDTENAKSFTTEELKSILQLLTRAYSEMKYAVLPQLPLELGIIEWSSEINQPIIVSSAKQSQVVNPPETSSKNGDSTKVWYQFIDKVKLQNHSIAGVLRGCYLQQFDDKQVVISAKYQFHKDKLTEQKTLHLIESIWYELSGNKAIITVELKN